jgi:hypothetical protein
MAWCSGDSPDTIATGAAERCLGTMWWLLTCD